MRLLLFLSLVFTLTLPSIAKAQSLNIIRDTEIERSLNEWFHPIMDGAGLPMSAVKLAMVNDERVNAFVAGGNNMFFFTGLLIETDNVGEVIGVFSHELGHVTGGHLVRSREALARSSLQAVVSTLVSIGAAIISGDGAVGSAGIQAGNAFAVSNYLAHSRIQESSADQAALTYLDAAKMNPEGFRDFLRKLENQELLPAAQQVEYVRTHPITRNRVDAVSTRIDESPYLKEKFPAKWDEQHKRMRAKLIGFLKPERVQYEFDRADNSIAANYARAISAYRLNNFKEAIALMDGLIEKEPKNAYFHELMGQIYRDSGDFKAALKHYKMANDYGPKSALIKMELGHVLLESERTDQNLRESVKYLKEAVALEPLGFAFRLLATAYGRLDEHAKAKLYLAESGLMRGDLTYARQQAESALKELETGSAEYLRGKDLLLQITQRQEKN